MSLNTHFPARPDDRLLCEKELASRWNCSVKMLQKARLTGGLVPFVRISRGMIRYRLSDIEAFEEQQVRTSTSDDGGRA